MTYQRSSRSSSRAWVFDTVPSWIATSCAPGNSGSADGAPPEDHDLGAERRRRSPDGSDERPLRPTAARDDRLLDRRRRGSRGACAAPRHEARAERGPPASGAPAIAETGPDVSGKASGSLIGERGRRPRLIRDGAARRRGHARDRRRRVGRRRRRRSPRPRLARTGGHVVVGRAGATGHGRDRCGGTGEGTRHLVGELVHRRAGPRPPTGRPRSAAAALGTPGIGGIGGRADAAAAAARDRRGRQRRRRPSRGGQRRLRRLAVAARRRRGRTRAAGRWGRRSPAGRP